MYDRRPSAISLSPRQEQQWILKEEKRNSLQPGDITMESLLPYQMPQSRLLGSALSSSLSILPDKTSGGAGLTMGGNGRMLVKGHTVTMGTPRQFSTSGALDRRHGRSCDLHEVQADGGEFKPLFNNPIAQVSSDILKVQGYSSQFRSLLSARRDSVPNVHIQGTTPTPETKNDKHLNGGVRFDPEVGGEPKQRSASTVRVIRRRQSGYGIAISSESTAKMRCRMRKLLFIRRNKICDLCLILAIAGLLFVVVDSELTALKKDTGIDKTHWASLLLRGAAVSSTISLMACLVNYHSIEVKIALIDSGADDWRVALSTDRILKLTLELIVCSICPFPGTGSINWPFISPETRKVTMISVPVDVLLSVPMFLRSYLLCRFMVLHSKQFQDAATRSIAALNRISMDFRFVIKTMMAEHPLRVLIVFTVTYWICMSWMFTQCERYDNKLNTEHYYMNSMWFIMVTFMSIGYGDIVPNTYCGRTLSIATGIVGAGVSSALIAVISRKLELSRAEKHVNNFMADSKLTNQRKNAAASVLQETWFIHKYKKSTNKGDELRLRHHQRRFLHSITEFRRIKWDQRKLQEKGNSLLDVGKLHADMHETLWEMHRTQDHFITQVDLLTQKIIELQNTLLQQGGHKTMPAMNSNQSTPQPNSIPPSFSLSRLNVPGGSQTPNTPSVTSSTNCIATGATTFANTQSVPIVSSPSDSHLFSNNNGQQQPGCINGTIYSQTNPTTPLMQSIDQD